MAHTWGDPHYLQPTECVANVSSWTDDPIVQYVTKIKALHVNELRAAIDAESTRRDFDTWPWTDDPTYIGLDIKKTHMDELRDAIENIKIGDCAADGDYCPEDTSDAIVWTDDPLVQKVTEVKKVHVDEVRGYINSMSVSCICESEQCEYCSDCGFRYSYCNHNGVACNDQCGAEGGCGQTVWNNACASINLPALTEHPYKSDNPAVVWDNTVPWVMGAADRPAAAWHDWDFYNPPGGGAPAHDDWDCKCNPYTWTT